MRVFDAEVSELDEGGAYGDSVLQGTELDDTPQVLPQSDQSAQPSIDVPQSSEPLRVQFGSDVQSGDPVFWEPTNTELLFNTNTGIIGTMGTGKTQFTKSLITQLYRNQHQNVAGKPIGILIFDYKADYVKEDFVQATNANVFDLYRLPFNPFALFGDRPMQPVHTANLFRSTLAKAFGLGGKKQQNKIRTLVMDAYQNAGITPQDRSSWKKTCANSQGCMGTLPRPGKSGARFSPCCT